MTSTTTTGCNTQIKVEVHNTKSLSMPIDDAVQDEMMNGNKSAFVYERWWNRYCEWKKYAENEKYTDDGNSVLNFLHSLKEKYASSTLWQAFSCLKKQICVSGGPNLSDHALLKQFLKQQDKRHTRKKASVFDEHDLGDFLCLSSVKDDDHITWIAAMVIGVQGALRISELLELTWNDLVCTKDGYEIWIRSSKTDQAKKGWAFHISRIDSEKPERDPFLKLTEYISRFEESDRTGRLFRKFQNGKPTKKVLGKNKLGEIPKNIAKFLNIENWENFSGHSFRRTSATILANSGASTLDLKRAGRWKSDKVAEEYVSESKRIKISTSKQISGVIAGNHNDQTRIQDTNPPVEEDTATKNKLKKQPISQLTVNIGCLNGSAVTFNL